MPVAQTGGTPARQALLVGLGALGALFTIVFLVARAGQLTNDDSVSIDTGEAIFNVGRVDELAPVIAEQGPLLLPDVSFNDRDIYVQHVGDDPQDGWFAFAVRPLAADVDCFVEWEADDRTFVDSCTDAVYGRNGVTTDPTVEPLPQYGVVVGDDGRLSVNLNATRILD